MKILKKIKKISFDIEADKTPQKIVEEFKKEKSVLYREKWGTDFPVVEKWEIQQEKIYDFDSFYNDVEAIGYKDVVVITYYDYPQKIYGDGTGIEFKNGAWYWFNYEEGEYTPADIDEVLEHLNQFEGGWSIVEIDVIEEKEEVKKEKKEAKYKQKVKDILENLEKKEEKNEDIEDDILTLRKVLNIYEELLKDYEEEKILEEVREKMLKNKDLFYFLNNN